jgi:DNA (cytosine-5)-methyltransferase 1
MEKTYSYIDLFAGCGGLSLGLCNAGWKGLFAIEKSKDAFKTLKHNLIEKKQHFSWVPWLRKQRYDINHVIKKYEKELISLRGKVDMVTGGPPCQGFSVAGRRNEKDKRNKLVKSYIRFIELVKPKIIFFENVKGFTLKFERNKEKGETYSTFVIQELEGLGYVVHPELIDFGNFGIPQKRTRFILVGVLNENSEFNGELVKGFFRELEKNCETFLINKSLIVNTNLEDAISDLLQSNGTIPSPEFNGFQEGTYSEAKSNYQTLMREGIQGDAVDSHRFANHTGDIVDRFRDILNRPIIRNKDIGKDLRDDLGLKKHTLVPLAKDNKCPTLTTLPDDYIHYVEPRILTVREYARIQTFPDWFEFQGKYTTGGKRRKLEVPRYTQIGNAIPPLFGEQGGIVLKTLLQNG